MISEKQYNILVGKSLAGLTSEEGEQFVEVLSKIEALLDDVDGDDYFGTEGWRYHLGWE